MCAQTHIQQQLCRPIHNNQKHQITSLFLSKELPIPCLNLHSSATYTITVVRMNMIRCKAAVEVET